MLRLIYDLQIGVHVVFVIAVVKTDIWRMETQDVQVCPQFHLIFVTLEQFLKAWILPEPGFLYTVLVMLCSQTGYVDCTPVNLSSSAIMSPP